MTVSTTIPCDSCDYSGLTIQCCRHPLMGGKNPMGQLVKEMHQASLMGQTWGDLIYDQEMEELAAETPEQAAARLMKREAADEDGADKLKAYEMNKRQSINTDAKTGALKHCTGRACRDAEMPAKWVSPQKFQGKRQEWAATDPKATAKPSKRPTGVPADAIFWGYGCEPHAKGCCPHLHPGQPGYDDVKAGRKPNVERIMATATYLSSKPAPKPSLLGKPVTTYKDAW